MINIPILIAYLKSKKGTEFTMNTLAILIIIIIGLIIVALFLTGKWADLVGTFGKVEKSALVNVPE